MAVTCSGKSLIPFNIAAFQGFIDSVVPAEKLPEFNIKFDARAKVKSVFAKLEGHDLTVYTGAIVSLGADKFPEIPDDLTLIMLFTIFGVKKAGQNESFEIKTTDQGVSNVKCDSDFQALAGRVSLFMQKFLPLNVVTPVENSSAPQVLASVRAEKPVLEKPVKEKKASKNESPYKGVPLGDTPQIEVPPDLDLKSV